MILCIVKSKVILRFDYTLLLYFSSHVQSNEMLLTSNQLYLAVNNKLSDKVLV